MHTAPPPQENPLLWERLRALFTRVIAAIGAPAVIAALSLSPRMRAEMSRQLALVEVMARKLLLAEAVALMAPPERGPRVVETPLAADGLYTLPPSRRRAGVRTRAIDPADPETWPARFALALPRDSRAVQDRRAPRIRALWGETHAAAPLKQPAPRRHHSDAFRVARRAEALRRVLDNPAPYARRLARARRIGVARSREAITHYALRAPRRFVGDRHDPKLTIDIFSAAIRAHAILTDTS